MINDEKLKKLLKECAKEEPFKTLFKKIVEMEKEREKEKEDIECCYVCREHATTACLHCQQPICDTHSKDEYFETIAIPGTYPVCKNGCEVKL